MELLLPEVMCAVGRTKPRRDTCCVNNSTHHTFHTCWLQCILSHCNQGPGGGPLISGGLQPFGKSQVSSQSYGQTRKIISSTQSIRSQQSARKTALGSASSEEGSLLDLYQSTVFAPGLPDKQVLFSLSGLVCMVLLRQWGRVMMGGVVGAANSRSSCSPVT